MTVHRGLRTEASGIWREVTNRLLFRADHIDELARRVHRLREGKREAIGKSRKFTQVEIVVTTGVDTLRGTSTRLACHP
jgi:hypothetical protein